MTSISVDGLSACAVSGGSALCWGYNFFGNLGNGSTTNATTPSSTGLTAVASIGAGELAGCALLSGGAVDCWGNNSFGEVGNAISVGAASTTAVAVTGFGGVPTALAVGGGTSEGLGAGETNYEGHSCVLVQSFDGGIFAATVIGGTVECWGGNEWGALGSTIAPGTSSSSPVVAVQDGATAVTSGAGFSCAIVSGAVECWGANDFGQLGNGTTTNSSSPSLVLQ